MNIIRLSERASRVAQGEVDVVAFGDQFVEILGFPGERLLQKPEEVFARRAFVVVSELDVVPPVSGGILEYQAEISILKPVFVYYLAMHILIPK